MTTGGRSSYRGLAIVATGVLAGLKLSGYLSWPWLAVAAPLWVPLALSASLRLALLAVILGLVWWIDPGGVTAELQALGDRVAVWLTR